MTPRGEWLREKTREDHDKFKILFHENINYGFHRNLFGLKPYAFGLDALVVIVCAICLWLRRPFNIKDATTITFLVLIGITVVQALYLGVFLTTQSVIDAGYQYARELVLSFHAFEAS